jgi:hypothetical protein
LIIFLFLSSFVEFNFLFHFSSISLFDSCISSHILPRFIYFVPFLLYFLRPPFPFFLCSRSLSVFISSLPPRPAVTSHTHSFSPASRSPILSSAKFWLVVFPSR